MNHNSFDIISAATSAVRFVVAERRYMFAAAVFPFIATLIANLMSYFMLKGQDSALFAVMLLLGEAAMDGWFMFLQTRLIVFGERLEQPPAEAAAARLRHNDMRAAVLTWMLFKLWLAAVVMYLAWTLQNRQADAFGIFTIIGLFLVGAWLWSIRLGVAHILVGVGYSVRQYLFRVNGLMGSLRLIGLALVISFPFQLAGMPLEEKLILNRDMETPEAVMILVAVTLISTAMLVFLNAAAVFALKDMLRRPDKRRGIQKV